MLPFSVKSLTMTDVILSWVVYLIIVFIIVKKQTESWVRVPTIPSCIWFQLIALGPTPYAGTFTSKSVILGDGV